MSTQIKVKWGKQEFDVDVEAGSSVEVFKTQIWTLTSVPVDKQKYLGFPGGLLKDNDNLSERVAKLKPGQKVTLMGTAEGGELKEPAEKTVFEEDLSPEERAKILKEKKVEVLPAGIKNLGNTCYMNSTLQCMNAMPEMKTMLASYNPPAAERDIDSVLTAQLKNTFTSLGNTTEAIVPLQFVMALRQRFPRFAEMQNGNYAQQDADECLRGLFTVLAGTCKGSTEGTNRIDELFGFKMTSKLRCLECDEEPPTESEESQRALMCHLGTQTDPVTHIAQGIQLSLKEHIEKNSTVLGRNAQYEKTSTLSSLPEYLVVQYARFGYKGANDWAGTAATKVKLIRKIAFSNTLDMFDCAGDDLKKKLSQGRLKRKEAEDARLEKERKQLETGKSTSSTAAPADEKKDVEMKPAEAEDAEMKPVEGEIHDTGYYELIAIISHKGRTADGGHYVAWCRTKKADGKEEKEDRWALFDDDTVSMHNWKDLCGVGTDLQGGKADTQIAYINFYKKVIHKEEGHVLGSKEDTEAAASTGDAPASSS